MFRAQNGATATEGPHHPPDCTVNDTTQRPPYRVLFVCMGNICRSPTAHGVFETRVREAGLGDRVDRMDETLVPYDFDWTEDTALTDDWLFERYVQLPYDVDFSILLDCCHSGGMAKGGPARMRGLNPPDDIRHRAMCWNADRQMWVPRGFAHGYITLEPDTEVPEASLFGPEPGRVAPHIYYDDEIVELLAAARTLGPTGSIRPFTYETLFGLMASTGLRVSEAIHLRDADVDLKRGMLTIHQAKFGKSRQIPLHPSTVEALRLYRGQCDLAGLSARDEAPFFVGTRGRRRGTPLGDRQVHRVFTELRERLGWRNRGAHHAPRIHDLRHTFVVRRILLWQAQGVDVDQAMLSLSTYVGHAMVTNTYWYLSAVPELMALAAGRFETFMSLSEVHDA